MSKVWTFRDGLIDGCIEPENDAGQKRDRQITDRAPGRSRYLGSLGLLPEGTLFDAEPGKSRIGIRPADGS